MRLRQLRIAFAEQRPVEASHDPWLERGVWESWRSLWSCDEIGKLGSHRSINARGQENRRPIGAERDRAGARGPRSDSSTWIPVMRALLHANNERALVVSSGQRRMYHLRSLFYFRSQCVPGHGPIRIPSHEPAAPLSLVPNPGAARSSRNMKQCCYSGKGLQFDCLLSTYLPT